MIKQDQENIDATEVTVVHIPKTLAEKIQRRLSQSDFKSMDEYVSYVLDNVMTELEASQKQRNEKIFSKEEEEGVEERLRNLGYM